jgi:hypothetical protein
MKTVLFCLFMGLLPGLGLAQQPAVSPPPSVSIITPADTTGRDYYLILRDSSFVYGRIVRRDSVIYTVRQRNGQFTYIERELLDRISLSRPADPAETDAPAETYYQPRPGRQQPQPSGPRQYRLTLRDGTRLTGFIVQQDSAQTVLKTSNIGQVTLPAGQIMRVDPVDVPNNRNGPDGRPVYDNLFPQWLTFVPTAIGAEKGAWSFRTAGYGAFSQFEYGVTENLSIGSTFYTFLPFAVFSLNAKVSLPVTERFHLAGMAQFATVGLGFSSSLRANQGIYQVMGTVGSRQKNVTLGYGRFSGGGSFVTFGLLQKLNRNLTFISQNNLAFGDRSYFSRTDPTFGALSGGLRVNVKRHSFDFSAFVPIIRSSDEIPFFVLISYQVRFGKPANR